MTVASLGTQVSLGASAGRVSTSTIEAWIINPGAIDGLHTTLQLSGEAVKTLQRAIKRKQITGLVGSSHLLTTSSREIIIVGYGYKPGDGFRPFQNTEIAMMDAIGQAVQVARSLPDIRHFQVHAPLATLELVQIAAEAVVLANHVHEGHGMVKLPEGTGPLETVNLVMFGGREIT